MRLRFWKKDSAQQVVDQYWEAALDDAPQGRQSYEVWTGIASFEEDVARALNWNQEDKWNTPGPVVMGTSCDAKLGDVDE